MILYKLLTSHTSIPNEDKNNFLINLFSIHIIIYEFFSFFGED